MKKILLFVLALTILSCSKISQSSLQGSWIVNSISAQEITANTDTGWKTQQAASSIFFTGESLTIGKSTITPCPSSSEMLKEYDDYPGYFNYSLSGTKLTIPEAHFSYVRKNGDKVVMAGEYTQNAMNFTVALNGNDMELNGTSEETDNLGNVKRRVNVKINLTKVQ